MAGVALRESVTVEERPGGKVRAADRASGAAHDVPAALAEALRRAAAVGETDDADLLGWLEARHLVMSERTRRVEAWGAARLGPRAGAVRLLPGSRFTCHGCGLCCQSYTLGPIAGAERERILERASDLAPHVATPVDRWFAPRPERDAEGRATYTLGRTDAGACVFLGADRLCEVHRRLGGERKPFICRRFPLAVSDRPDGVLVTIRPECETLARSRDDGEPLADQMDWVRAIAAEERNPTRVAGLVRVMGDCHVPYPLARAIEEGVLDRVRSAAPVEDALLAVRDLVLATAQALRAHPDPEDLDRAEAIARAGPAGIPGAAAGPGDPRAAMGALGALSDLLIGGLDTFVRLRGEELPGSFAASNTLLAADVIRTLRASLSVRLGWPVPPGLPSDAVEEARRAAAVGAGSHDPAVQDFVRSAIVEVAGGSRPLAAGPGLVYGYAHVALTVFVARWGARLQAARRGAVVAGREDWNRALGLADRTLRLMDLAGAASAVVAFFANLFAADDLPT